jgi:hypothetical protein
VEFKGQKLHALEREAELDFTVKFVVREVSDNASTSASSD